MEAYALHYVRTPEISHSHLQAKGLKHLFVAQCAIHISKKCLATGEMFGPVDYMGVLDGSIAHLGPQTWLIVCQGRLLGIAFSVTIRREMVGGGCWSQGRRVLH